MRAASLCSGLGLILLICEALAWQVEGSLAPVTYRLWISDLAAASVKRLTSCLGNRKTSIMEIRASQHVTGNRLLAL